jgi:Tol biopolymer transport system component
MSIQLTMFMTAIALVSVSACSKATEQTCANQIVFDSTAGGRTEVFILDIASGATTQLTNNVIVGGDSRFPDFAPGGGQVVFVSENEEGLGQLFVVDSRGNGVRQLTDDEAIYSNPAWSPDGEWIAFEKAKHGEWGLYLIQPDGSSLKRIGPTDVNLFHPSWSPDASHIAVVTGDGNTWMVGVLNLHDGAVRRFAEPGIGVGSVKWSTDGTKLAFDAVSGTNFDLYILDLETLMVDRLTKGPAIDSRPEWSPDMTQLVFNSTRDRGGSVSGDERWEEFELYLFDLKGRNVQRVTDNEWFDAHPDWCPPESVSQVVLAGS